MSRRDSTYEIHKLVESSEHSRDFPSRIELDTEALVQILLQFRRLHFPSCHHDDDDDQPLHLQTTKSAGGDGETKNERKEGRKEGGCNQSGVGVYNDDTCAVHEEKGYTAGGGMNCICVGGKNIKGMKNKSSCETTDHLIINRIHHFYTAFDSAAACVTSAIILPL